MASTDESSSSFAPVNSETLLTPSSEQQVEISSPHPLLVDPVQQNDNFVDFPMPLVPALADLPPENAYAMKYNEEVSLTDSQTYRDIREIISAGFPEIFRVFTAYRVRNLKVNIQFANNALDQSGVLWVFGIRDPYRTEIPSSKDFLQDNGTQLRYGDKIGLRIGNNCEVLFDQVSTSWYFSVLGDDLRNSSPGGIGFVTVGSAPETNLILTWTAQIEFAIKTITVPNYSTLASKTIPVMLPAASTYSIQELPFSSLYTVTFELPDSSLPDWASDVDVGQIYYFASFVLLLEISAQNATYPYSLPTSTAQLQVSAKGWSLTFDISPIAELNLGKVDSVIGKNVEYPFGELRYRPKQ